MSEPTSNNADFITHSRLTAQIAVYIYLLFSACALVSAVSQVYETVAASDALESILS